MLFISKLTISVSQKYYIPFQFVALLYKPAERLMTVDYFLEFSTSMSAAQLYRCLKCLVDMCCLNLSLQLTRCARLSMGNVLFHALYLRFVWVSISFWAKTFNYWGKIMHIGTGLCCCSLFPGLCDV